VQPLRPFHRADQKEHALALPLVLHIVVNPLDNIPQLLLEAAHPIIHIEIIGVAHIGQFSGIVDLPGVFEPLVAGHVVLQSVEILGPVGRRVHEDDCIVVGIPQVAARPPLQVQHALVNLLRDVRAGVNDAPIADDDSGHPVHPGNVHEVPLGLDLVLDEPALEVDHVLDLEVLHHDHDAGMDQLGRQLGHDDHPESLALQVLAKVVHRGRLACAGAAGDADFVDVLVRGV
jgi:hypothetical protein